MANVTKVQEAAEAICGALHDLTWQFMGETDNGASTWFIRGEKPKQVRIEVVRSKLADVVLVNVEWLNLSQPPEIKRGRQTLQVDVREGRSPNTFAATQRAVEKCLSIFRDVLTGTGVASKKALQTTYAAVDMSVLGFDDELGGFEK